MLWGTTETIRSLPCDGISWTIWIGRDHIDHAMRAQHGIAEWARRTVPMSANPPRRTAYMVGLFAAALLLVEFADEFVFGAREAAWPLIRSDLGLTYAEVGLLLGLPNVIANLVEPLLGILGDVWKRRLLILGGGVCYVLALVLFATSGDLLALLL